MKNWDVAEWGSPVRAMYTWLRDTALPKDAYDKLSASDKTGRIPIGTFADGQEPGLETRYAALRRTLAPTKEDA